jgi:hypothetical protein
MYCTLTGILSDYIKYEKEEELEEEEEEEEEEDNV